MFIQTETTPNPQSLKFIPGVPVLGEGITSFHKGEDCARSPLAKKLFEIDGIETVFFAPDFLTLTKTPEYEWLYLKPDVLSTIMEHFVAGLPVIVGQSQEERVDQGTQTSLDEVSYDMNDPIIKQIVEILETRVRPAVAQDGGDISFDRFEDGVVFLKLQGACSGCPSSSATLKSGIENMLRYYVPEVQEVRAA